MTDPNKTVFISYRRSTSQELARAIFMHLKYNGYDAFFDVNAMDNGAFDEIILNQIGARTHFISIISKGAFERCVDDGAWGGMSSPLFGKDVISLMKQAFCPPISVTISAD